MRHIKHWLAWMCVLAICFALPLGAQAAGKTMQVDASRYTVTKDGAYTTVEEVAVYLSAYGTLPPNYISKRQAEALGWDNRAGNLDQVAPGKSIGGDRFGNYEGSLPDLNGRKWTECDIGFSGGYRSGERLVFSNDGLIFYSDDHYNTFRQVVVTGEPSQTAAASAAPKTSAGVTEDGFYTARDDVAAYIQAYGTLPGNYLTRDEAKDLGWSSKKDNLGQVAPGYAIGGDSFGNREGLLPGKKGRVWWECDVNGVDGKRSDERLVFSNDGLIYYTPDAHKSFEPLS